MSAASAIANAGGLPALLAARMRACCCSYGTDERARTNRSLRYRFRAALLKMTTSRRGIVVLLSFEPGNVKHQSRETCLAERESAGAISSRPCSQCHVGAMPTAVRIVCLEPPNVRLRFKILHLM